MHNGSDHGAFESDYGITVDYRSDNGALPGIIAHYGSDKVAKGWLTLHYGGCGTLRCITGRITAHYGDL